MQDRKKFGWFSRNKEINQSPKVGPVVPVVTKTVFPADVVPATQTHIHGSLTAEQCKNFPIFSENEIFHFVTTYAPPDETVNTLPVLADGNIKNLPISATTTTREIYGMLAAQYQAADFVVQLGDLLFRMDKNECGSERWLDITRGHRCHVMVCSQNKKTWQHDALAALHATGFANAFVTEDDVVDPASPYHVIFLDVPQSPGHAENLVRVYARDCKVEDGWIYGHNRTAKGALLWAPLGKSSEEDWLKLMKKLRQPVRVMLCAPYDERFIIDVNKEQVRSMSRIFSLPVTGCLDLVLTGQPASNVSNFNTELLSYAQQCVTAMAQDKWLDGLQYRYWISGGTFDSYTKLTPEQRHFIGMMAGRMVHSIQDEHGAPLHRLTENMKAHTTNIYDIPSSNLLERDLKPVAQIIAAALDVDLLLRTNALYGPPYTEEYKKILQEKLKNYGEFFGKLKTDVLFGEGRKFLVDAVHHMRRTEVGRKVEMEGVRLGLMRY